MIAGTLIRELERKLPEALREEQGEILHPLPSGPGPKASGYQQDLFLTRAAHLLCSQRQGAQEIRIWHQSFGWP